MKTDQLISVLVADRAVPAGAFARALPLALAAGGIVSIGLFFIELGFRKDLAAAFDTWRFDLKLVMVLLAFVLAFGLCRALCRPVPPRHAGLRLLPLLALAAVAVAIEFSVVPANAWGARLVGTNWLVCLTAVPMLAIAPLIVMMVTLRSTAPASPVLAGAAAGFLAAMFGAALYAFHCFDDSPLFVVTWYTLAAIPMIALGAVTGRWLLRW